MMTEKIDKLLELLTHEKHFRVRLFWEGIAVGIASGLSVGLFRYLLSASVELRPFIYNKVQQAWAMGQWQWPCLYAAAFICIAYIVAKIVEKEPMCTGSGIPQIKGILMGKMYMRWYSVLAAKIIGGVLAIGAGLSLGREGPSVQIGAAAGQGVSRSAGRTRFEERILLTAGAGAGLAAAFNAPLAGVIFGLEELQKSFSSVVLMASITASITATTVIELFFGMEPVFTVGELLPLPIAMYGILLALGLFIGVISRLFNKTLLFSLNTYDRLGLTGMRKALLPLAVAAVLGLILPEILGGGNRLVDSLIVENYSLYFLAVLFIGKFLFTMLCFGSGVPGGIFLPMLVLGAAGGAVFSKILVLLQLMPADYMPHLIVFGMAAYFAAVVKSPVTGSILIMEMTGSFSHMLPLICVSMMAYVVADLMGGKPVYDELLNRSLVFKGQHQNRKLLKDTQEKRAAVELVVDMGSAAAGRKICDISWPEKTILVDIRRGMYQLVPEDSLTLQAGDYLYILANDNEIADLESLVSQKMT